MPEREKVNILLVDDQPAKLLSYEVILAPLNENLLKAASAAEAFRLLLKHDIAVVLVDVSMPELDGFQLATMIREHPRFRQTAIIFVSAIHISEIDSLRGYELGAVDYMSVPVAPELLRAKVRVFVDLYRKTRELQGMNAELERRVAERTADLKAAIDRVMLLAREVDHRAKNMLAVIESMLALTRADTIEEYSAAVLGRIRALANAHALLSQSRWTGADLRRLVQEELAAFADGARVTVTGPSVMLKPAPAQSLAIAIHELATNAAKYGALSVESGRLSVAWSKEGDSLHLSWVETGGPEVAGAQTQGFGMKVIAASIESQLSGSLRLDWRREGLRCALSLPAAHFEVEDRAERPVVAPAAGAFAAKAAEPAGLRVLVVEDEALIGMMIADHLRRAGVTVVGPALGLADAFKALDGGLDAAILDINLGGATVYPFADALLADGVPIVFLTGYDAGAIDARFSGAPVLQKPVDFDQLCAALSASRAAQREPAPAEMPLGLVRAM